MSHTLTRRAFLGASAGVAGMALLATDAQAATPTPGGAPALVAGGASQQRMGGGRPARRGPLSNASPVYDRDINYALMQGSDLWGDQLLALPDGPTLANVRALLGPANIGSRYITESGWYYLPMTDVIPDPATWLTQRDFAIHVADGSQITAQWCWADYPAARQYANVQVGSHHEAFGSRLVGLETPRLFGGHLPILENDYVDGDGTRWARESFVARHSPDGPLLSYLKFTAHRGRRGPTTTTLRLALHITEVDSYSLSAGRLAAGNNTYLLCSADGSWQSPNLDIDLDLGRGAAEVFVIIANTPAPTPGITASARAHQSAKEAVASYWNHALERRTPVDIPESYASHAMANLLIQNLVMGWQQSIANGYETTDPSFAFVPEVSTSVAALGYFGFLDSYRANLTQILAKGQGPAAFPDWEEGIKLQSAANYYLLSDDPSYITDHLAEFVGYLDDFTSQRQADPHHLLDKEQYASDIGYPVYGLHHQSDCWRGMRDFGVALGLMGEHAMSQRFLDEAAAFRTSLTAAITASAQHLPDGSVFVPISLLDPQAPQAWDEITATRLGSYWNIIAPYALATGILPPGSELANGLLKYINTHGSLLLGLSRFNATGINPPGVYETDAVANFPPDAAGYNTPGIDEQYTYSLLKFLADNGHFDSVMLTFYGMLGQGLTPGTFIGGEGATISPSPELPENYRSQWFPPLSASNAVYLRALREMLLHEDLDDEGMPAVLHLAAGTPRAWLADGQHIAVSDLPSLFGPTSFRLESQVRRHRVRVTVDPPVPAAGRATMKKLWLHARVPAGYRLAEAQVDGRPLAFDGDAIDLGAPASRVTVDLRYRRVAPAAADQARPTVVQPDRLIFQPGTTAPLRVTVEVLGASTVTGAVTVGVPHGWPVPGAARFRIDSRSEITRRDVDVDLRIPALVPPGDYPIVISADPRDGTVQTRTVTVTVARAAAGTYRELVLAARPAAYWRLGESSGTVAADSSGNGANGTFEGTVDLDQPGAIADDSDGCVRLAGGYVLVPDNPHLNVSGPYTLEAWVKVVSASQQGIIEKYDTPAYNGYLLRTVSANKLYAENLNTALPLPPAAVGTTTLVAGIWHHLASVFDGQNLRIVLDGRVEATVATTAAPTPGTDSLKIGARGDDANERLDGWVDEVAIYDHALSVAELAAHFEKGVLGRRVGS